MCKVVVWSLVFPGLLKPEIVMKLPTVHGYLLCLDMAPASCYTVLACLAYVACVTTWDHSLGVKGNTSNSKTER
jgi:hypothetical protein